MEDKWNVYDAEGNWLGTIHGCNEEQAMSNARRMMQNAARVEERDIPIYPHERAG